MFSSFTTEPGVQTVNVLTEMGHSDVSQAAWLRWLDTSARVTT